MLKSPNIEPHCAKLTLQSLHQALRAITEVLAKEVSHPTAVAPDWTDTQWTIARAVASIHGISGLLAGALRWPGPPVWSAFLASQKNHMAARFQRLEQLMHSVDEAAQAAGIELTALKGATLHAWKIYQRGERPMADIDLLVRKEDEQRAVQLLESLGLSEVPSSPRHRSFEQRDASPPVALGEHRSNGLKIELHNRICEMLPVRVVDISHLIGPASFSPGLRYYASKAALLIHLLLHAAGALTTRELRILHIYDIDRVARCMRTQDWNEMFCLTDASDGLWWAFPPLCLAARYCGGVPDWVIARTFLQCPRLLRSAYRDSTVYEVSLSYLWVSAVPGIRWATSLSEMLRYVWTRAVPSEETVRLRAQIARSQPRVSGGSWAELPQRRRFVRWLLSGEARQATLQPVSAALGSILPASLAPGRSVTQ